MGVVHLALHQFARTEAGDDGWSRVQQAAHLPDVTYVSSVRYPDEHITAVVVALSKETRTGVGDVISRFGRFLAPVLLERYDGFLDSAWRTLDLIEHTEEVIHRAVRINEPTAAPPRLQVTRTGAAQARVVYTSPRRLCRLAKGLIEGVAAHYGEPVSVTDAACMFDGDEHCELVVTALTRPTSARTTARR